MFRCFFVVVLLVCLDGLQALVMAFRRVFNDCYIGFILCDFKGLFIWDFVGSWGLRAFASSCKSPQDRNHKHIQQANAVLGGPFDLVSLLSIP